MMNEFMVCPGCRHPDVRRTSCDRCGYVAQDRTTARASGSSSRSSGLRFLSGFGGMVRGVVILAALVMIVGGYREYRLGAHTSAEPQDVELAALEGGLRPQNYVRIGQHYRVYDATLQVTRTNKKTQTTTAEEVYYYPIVSAEHPLIHKSGKDTEAKAPETFAVLVRHKGPLDLKTGTQPAASIQGLIVNDADSLEQGGEETLRKTFPKFDSEHVLILEEGGKPTSPVVSIALLAAGVLLVLATIGFYFVRRRNAEED